MIGDGHHVDDSPRDAGTIGYEVLTSLARCRALPPRAFRADADGESAGPSFVCQNCGAAYSRWQGKCEACGEWNTLVEEGATAAPVGRRPPAPARAGRSRSSRSPARPRTRRGFASGIAELDRVTGGGFVRGSVLLVGGDPGIGKSTLLIQAAAALARAGQRAVYISGEEAVAQVRLRAERLGLAEAPVELAAETSVEDIIATLSEGKTPRLVVINSIQTMWTDTVEVRARHGDAGARLGAGADPLCQEDPALRSSWSATSPRTARSPARAWSSTWSMRCCLSKAKARTSSASCAR